jgi:hypothetical protein
MSYSFIVRAVDKADAALKVAAELDKVVEAQSIHAADRHQAEAAAVAFIGLLPDDDTKAVQVNLHGSVGFEGTADAPKFINASVGISASLVSKEVAA